ncbi:hypothetical protein B296_00028159 [Ensete ventricosum]|uniref:Uncharacterized protein n=1 Tax=Ensete ventricosum TaxID=4639 RepID=A0A426YFN5_ENSVE|nr:hypothetical protein B296_00028159 [Ensete ventricosum]
MLLPPLSLHYMLPVAFSSISRLSLLVERLPLLPLIVVASVIYSATCPVRSFYPLPLLDSTDAFFLDSRPQLYRFSTMLSNDSLCSILLRVPQIATAKGVAVAVTGDGLWSVAGGKCGWGVVEVAAMVAGLQPSITRLRRCWCKR